ncbi:hypothetical protein CJ030_MR8G003130 [Morella rubra]|uniref:FLZ-type domain-containing protein n=1 Tax=Morella rubra TaxID=262757 RepID=A0A6A1USD6_9ROSI|nr:hypothetical protein CJ030_MR8G003128 [Morella rubra]KAB1203317.1 hypothetical protein CJ030_MR8G003130 [Morella rubra]
MQAKRSRTVRSSSFGDTSLLNQVLPPPATVSPELRLNVRNSSENPAFARPSKYTAESAQHPSGILTLASADVEDESPEEHIGNFLEKCYYCKRGIAEGDEVFMYR